VKAESLSTLTARPTLSCLGLLTLLISLPTLYGATLRIGTIHTVISASHISRAVKVLILKKNFLIH